MKKNHAKFVIVITILTVVIIALSGCEFETYETSQSAAKQENSIRQSNYERLAESQPAHEMNYSPTRATKNFWIDTWGTPGKLSYVYLMNGTGDLIGYYIFEGLPVSYGVSLVPPYEVLHNVDLGEYHGDIVVPSPSIDGTYASAANVNTFYGKDALTGMYIEYTVGFGINALLYSEPMPLQGREEPLPLGAATFDTIKE